MFLSVRELELRKLHFEHSISPGEIEFLEGLRQGGPLHVEGTAELVGSTEEIRVRGHVRVRMDTECDRCL